MTMPKDFNAETRRLLLIIAQSEVCILAEFVGVFSIFRL
ncbi:hypothetical protein GV51_1027 [Gardnerella vaginalis 5-1]|nr:hypothetical protein GV51_1027 [Gardnerella vaginalis 5-1]